MSSSECQTTLPGKAHHKALFKRERKPTQVLTFRAWKKVSEKLDTIFQRRYVDSSKKKQYMISLCGTHVNNKVLMYCEHDSIRHQSS